MSSSDLVTSEVNAAIVCKENGIDTTSVISSFTLTLPRADENQAVERSPKFDKDGDLIRENRYEIDLTLVIEHKISTDLSKVGLQVWSGALFLADFFLAQPYLVQGLRILELGAGTGLTSIAVSKFCDAKSTVATDIQDVLENLKANIHRNASDAQVAEVDLFKVDYNQPLLEDIDVVIGADIVYDNDLSDAIVSFIFKMRPNVKKFYFSIEKRYIFTTDDLDTVAPCYEFFLARLAEKSDMSINVHSSNSIRQYFCYERSPDLVVIEIN